MCVSVIVSMLQEEAGRGEGKQTLGKRVGFRAFRERSGCAGQGLNTFLSLPGVW